MSAASQITPVTGVTYHIRLPQHPDDPGDRARMYVTVNERDGKPFEVFIRYDLPGPFEWVFAVSILISRLLQAGVELEDIGRELQEIHSPVTNHIIPGTSETCPSTVARLGKTLEAHAKYIAGKGV